MLVLALLLGAYLCLRGSLPALEGNVSVPGLNAAVIITRDARGVPTIEARNRADLAWATGFLHAQDRFFQMDLSRRLAAGELAELVGRVALEQDRNARLFRFRSVARQVLAQATPEQRALMEAYTRGVNAGLVQLRARPWEYWVLGQPPAQWRIEDSILVSYAMWWDLQANGLRRAILRRRGQCTPRRTHLRRGLEVRAAVPVPGPAPTGMPPTSRAPEPPATPLPVPPPDVLDLRSAGPVSPRQGRPGAGAGLGSNNWAVAGRADASGAALVANDMHLSQRVPTIWYHARLQRAAPTPTLDLNGVTLPGTPLLVAGSNGHIAWGFTNSYGDWAEGAAHGVRGRGRARHENAAGPGAAGGGARSRSRCTAQPRRSSWCAPAPRGLLLRVDAAAHACWFGSWLALLPAATNLNLMGLERATTVDEALELAPQMGIPDQNAVVGDREGHIGWTLFARIPQDTGAQRAAGTSGWTR